MKLSWLVVPALAIVLGGCSSQGGDEKTVGTPAPSGGDTVAAPSAVNDGVTLSIQTPTRVKGSYADATSVDTLQFDFARVGDDLFGDLTGDNGRPILHIETVGENYEFSYMGGALNLHTTKTFIAAAKVQAAENPEATSTSGFVFTGDMKVLDDMLHLPEVALLPSLSRALGVRGITGSDFPASLALHKIGRQAADGLAIRVQPLDAPASTEGYCQSYPNPNNGCFGMCGEGCDCWSWVCGDCCYHNGCAQHDTWCRDGEWYYCYNITAVIALFGC